MTWNSEVSTYYKNYMKSIEINQDIETYIQAQVVKKTLETVSLERRR